MRLRFVTALWGLRALGLLLALFLTVGSSEARSRKSSSSESSSSSKSKGKSRSGDEEGRKLDPAFLERVNAAVASRDFATATRQLGDAYRKNPDPELLYHLGRVAAADGKIVEAHDLLRRYLADPGRGADSTSNAEDAQKLLRQARPVAGEVSLLADPGALVVIDERPVGVLPLPQPLLLSGGLHTLSLEYKSRKLASPVQVVNGRLLEMRFNAASAAVVFTLRPALLIVPLGSASTLAEGIQRSISEQMEQAALAERLAVMPLEVALGNTPKLKDCLGQSDCRRDLARENKAEYVLSYEVRSREATAQNSWQIDLSIHHATIRTPAGTASKSCGPCTLEQATAALRDTVGQLIAEGTHRKRGSIELASEPAAAEVRDSAGQVLGKTPLSLPVFAGSHELSLALPGFLPEKRRVEVAEGRRVTVSVPLQSDAPEPPPEALKPPPVAALPPSPPPSPPPPPPPTGREPRPVWRIATGSVAMALGVGLIGFGLSGVLLEDECVRPPSTPGGTCRQVYNSAPTGGALMLSGIGLTIAGVVLVAIPGPRRK